MNKAYDLMAMNTAHSLYHLGFIKYFNNIEINLHCSCALIEANQYYRGANLKLNNVRFHNTLCLYSSTCRSLLKRKSVIFIGIHLWQALILIPLIIFNGNVSIHLHGQAYALKHKSAKYYIWKTISFFCKLFIATPSWQGPQFVEQIINLNHIHNAAPSTSKSANAIYYSAVGKRPAEISILKKRLEAKSLSLVLIDLKMSYKQLNHLLSNTRYLYFECIDEYYLYSPSGRISDALNYGLKLVLCSEDKLGIHVAKQYGVEFLLI